MRTDMPNQSRSRSIIGGGIIGFVVAGTLALPSILPSAVAQEKTLPSLLISTVDELMANPINGDDFVKPGVTVEPWVSTRALSRSTVRKIGYGRTEFVEIVETDTGIYSSDGLASPYVQYPGIHEGTTSATRGYLAMWDGGWVQVQPFGAGSFVTTTPFIGGKVQITDEGACVHTAYGLYC